MHAGTAHMNTSTLKHLDSDKNQPVHHPASSRFIPVQTSCERVQGTIPAKVTDKQLSACKQIDRKTRNSKKGAKYYVKTRAHTHTTSGEMLFLLHGQQCKRYINVRRLQEFVHTYAISRQMTTGATNPGDGDSANSRPCADSVDTPS